MKRSCLWLGLPIILFLISVAFPDPAARSTPDLTPPEKECYARVGPALRASDGLLTPEVRNSYLEWAEQSVLDQLKQGNSAAPEDILSEVRQDDTLRVAVFGSVFPPDPSILQNYAQLRTRLSPELAKKYRSLVVAVAVAKRMKGVENAEQAAAIGRDYQPGFWVDSSLQAPGSEPEKQFANAIADYLKRQRLSVTDVYENPAVQNELKADLSKQGIRSDFINGVGKSVWFGERLKYVMVLLGQRPGAREVKPDTVTWIKYLITRNEATPTSTPVVDGRPMAWPQFPIQGAPWPLLMPLAHPVPLSEADYIWEAFQGQHGPDRYHTYGPYRGDDGVIPDSLRPSKWFWDAWPDSIVHGGMCVPLSKATVDFYSSLGKPAMWAGQPGHANLITFQCLNDTWTAEIEQAFAGGPDVTFAQWYFDEDHGTVPRARDLYDWPGAEYQLGLAVGMNVSLTSYMDTRLASHIFRVLPPDDKRTVGVRLLRNAILTNPYNPAPWYRLAEQMPDGLQGLNIIEAAMKTTPGLLANRGDDDPFRQARQASGARDQYWRTLTQFLTHYAVLSRPIPPREEERRRVYTFLKTIPYVGAGDLASYVERFAQLDPAEPNTDDLEYDRASAKAGDSFGMVRMGQRYRDGDGVGQVNASAAEFFARAVGQGDAAAAVLLGRLIPAVPAGWVSVTASSTHSPQQAAQHLIDGSGMVGAVHDNDRPAGTMWHTSGLPSATRPAPGIPASPAWVRFDFAHPAKIESLLIWNHNQLNYANRGFRATRLYGSVDGANWMPITAPEVIEMPSASGKPFALPIEIPVRSPERPLKAVIIAADGGVGMGNYGGDCYGLSAVRFLVHRVPESVPAKTITVTASTTYSPQQATQHLIDGIGMYGACHDNDASAATMWHTKEQPAPMPPAAGLAPSPAWVRFDFARPTRFQSLLVWNHNQLNYTDRGFRKVRIYGSSDGIHWRLLTDSPTVELPRSNGSAFSEPSSVLNVAADRALKSVIIAAEVTAGNYGGNCYGLSAVRFLVNQ